ncbi:hypothetical protein DUF3048 [Gottschalkia acidurici 9a]|uniref:DUF3048 domain-containing protein n=1 Tax=Gottschalkia acidurici (strain ATCC 7906 / DSM 604 / BCRC 14475 / CIP 104303 / KCTC 5404 / NCIMB 10678 / 9a) TaxID=1128398 RepID=K0AZW1_GOTA9|nr:DUF3048 domain-containing protein [Gottschalkia acidurici]AFS78819.1 hypothetical protein DUF3048 [Gottschalkia acidurici 9a]
MKKSKLALLLIILFILSSVVTYGILKIKDKSSEGDLTLIMPDEEIKDIEENKKEIIQSPFSGVEIEKEILEKRPVAVMFDNHPRARWQAGLSKAEIVYELPAEEPYTRYIGIYLINDPEVIGPVRSTRPYFVETIVQYDPLYVRCGGSEDGKEYVRRYGIADIDGLTSSAFWRSKNKKAPHNLYISMENIRKEQTKLNYSKNGNYYGYNFNEKDTDIEGQNGENIIINYNKSNSTKYIYDSGQKVYERYKDGKLHIDEADNTTIKAKNIIIQEVTSKIIDNEGRKKINVVGSGKATYITDGKAKDITWRKRSANDKTTYYDELGVELTFNPGVTWIQVVPTGTHIEIG